MVAGYIAKLFCRVNGQYFGRTLNVDFRLRRPYSSWTDRQMDTGQHCIDSIVIILKIFETRVSAFTRYNRACSQFRTIIHFCVCNDSANSNARVLLFIRVSFVSLRSTQTSNPAI